MPKPFAHYFLATLFLQNSQHEEWATRPEVRCQQVFKLSKQIRNHVASAEAFHGLNAGNVPTVDDNYGMAHPSTQSSTSLQFLACLKNTLTMVNSIFITGSFAC